MSSAEVATESPEIAADDQLCWAETKIANLERALDSSRTIGMALGIVIERCSMSESDAFDVLVRISQQQHRKVRDVASELIFTGAIA